MKALKEMEKEMEAAGKGEDEEEKGEDEEEEGEGEDGRNSGGSKERGRRASFSGASSSTTSLEDSGEGLMAGQYVRAVHSVCCVPFSSFVPEGEDGRNEMKWND